MNTEEYWNKVQEAAESIGQEDFDQFALSGERRGKTAEQIADYCEGRKAVGRLFSEGYKDLYCEGSEEFRVGLIHAMHSVLKFGGILE